MKFKNHYNSKPDKGEINNKPSLTVPDQTMSVTELLKRYASGMPIGGKSPLYHGETEDDDIGDHVLQNMDQLDRIDYLREKEQEFLKLKTDLEEKVRLHKRDQEINRRLKEEEDRRKKKEQQRSKDQPAVHADDQGQDDEKHQS